MTREEAILLSAYTGFLLVPDFSEVHKFCEDALGHPIWTHEFADSCVQKEIQEKLRPQIMELIQNISALRPITRERLEKVWGGEWEPGNPICPICGKDKFDGLDADIWADWMPNFCPHCGAPMTNKAVDIVMERLEALYDKDM